MTHPLRLLADENLRTDYVEALRQRGHDVALQVRLDPSADDALVLLRAEREGRVLLTFDKDFGELAFRARLPATVGVLLFRFPATASRIPLFVQIIETYPLSSPGRWAGWFASVSERSGGVPFVRVRSLPPTIADGDTGRDAGGTEET